MQVVDEILESGKKLAESRNSSEPLLFEWHDKEYLGAAHGYCGILNVLLMVFETLSTPQTIFI